MPEEVKVRITQESAGNALAETEAKIKQLYQAAAAYESKGMGDAAKSARGDARALEGDLARLAKERATAEHVITRQKAEQLAIEKAQAAGEARRMGMFSRLGRAGANFAESTIGAGGFGGVTNALGGIGGAAGTTGAVAIAALVKVLSDVSNQAHALKLMGLADETAGAAQRHQLGRLGGFEGSAGSAREQAADAKEEIARREADRARLAEEAKPRWNSPSSWMKALSGENQNASIENEQAITRAREKQAEAARIQKEKFGREGEEELNIERKRLEHDWRGSRQAEHRLLYVREYNRLLREGAQEWQAQEGAGMKVFAKQREETAALGGRVNARSGAGDIARLASLSASINGGGDSSPAINSLHDTVKQQGYQVMIAATQMDFTKR